MTALAVQYVHYSLVRSTYVGPARADANIGCAHAHVTQRQEAAAARTPRHLAPSAVSDVTVVMPTTEYTTRVHQKEIRK